jgi:hypothetical protein
MRQPFLALSKTAAVILITLMTGTTSAQQTPSAVQAYDVELVVFRILSTSATPEDWGAEKGLQPQELAVPDEDQGTAGAIAPPPPVATSTETFPALPPPRFKLSGIEDTLKRSRNYQVLGHFGWTQPGFPRTEAHYMSIDSLMTGDLTGRVALARGRYLHFTVDLALNDSTGERFLLQHTRRMRSNERHYIDHPKFGVIALVTPSQS